HTSDDTKLLELRPHKRPHNDRSVTFDGRASSTKKLKLPPSTKEDLRPSSL
ncbi:hypothetical protein C1646_755727, partial [Rhizophagus diaphanus]